MMISVFEIKANKKIKNSTPAGFEPTRVAP